MQKDSMLGPAVFGLLAVGCSPPQPRGGTTLAFARIEAPARAPRPPARGPTSRSDAARRADADVPTPDAEIEAARVIEAVHPQLLACYAKRLGTRSASNVAVTFDVWVGPDGRPRETTTTGGALLGAETLRCMTAQIRRVTFAPPSASGTTHVRVPFAFAVESASAP